MLKREGYVLYPLTGKDLRSSYTVVIKPQDILSLSYFFSDWCERRDLNPQAYEKATDFKSVVYTNSTTLAIRLGHL